MKKIFSLGLIFILTISLMGCQKKYVIEGLDENNIGEFEQEDLKRLREVDDMYFDIIYNPMQKLINSDNDTKMQQGIRASDIYTGGFDSMDDRAEAYRVKMVTDMGRRELENYIEMINKYYHALKLYNNGELQKGDELLTEDSLQEYKAFHELIVEYTE